MIRYDALQFGHHDGCDRYYADDDDPEPPCNCGATEAQALLDALRTERDLLASQLTEAVASAGGWSEQPEAKPAGQESDVEPFIDGEDLILSIDQEHQ